MTKWHAQFVQMTKHINMVGGPFLVGGPGHPLNPALVRDVVLTKKVWEHTQKSSHFKTASNSI